MDDLELKQRSEGYVDAIFGPGTGARHARFLDGIEDESLRAEIHRYHAIQADTSQLSLEEHYLLATCVLCAKGSYATAGMFAKTLRHLGVPREKVLAAVGRLAMWIGGIPAVEATGHIRRALDEYDRQGMASMAAWFPEPNGSGNGSNGGGAR
jgi:hypothetical protein